jgi:hypothetical protein
MRPVLAVYVCGKPAKKRLDRQSDGLFASVRSPAPFPPRLHPASLRTHRRRRHRARRHRDRHRCSGLNVFAHNLETTERLTPRVRDRRATYRQSLAVLEGARALNRSLVTKTSVMLGVGESEEEVRQTMRDALAAGVEIFTLGQYLQVAARAVYSD